MLWSILNTKPLVSVFASACVNVCYRITAFSLNIMRVPGTVHRLYIVSSMQRNDFWVYKLIAALL